MKHVRKRLSWRWKPDPYFTIGLLSVALLGGVYYRDKAQAYRSFNRTDVPEEVITRLDSLGLGYRLGESTAPVRVVELFDYQCPACAASHTATWRMLQQYAQKGVISYTVYDLVLPQHGNGVPAAVVAGCIAREAPAQFWRFRDQLFATRSSWETSYRPESGFVQMAAGLQVDTSRVRNCLDQEAEDRIEKVLEGWKIASAAGVTSIPKWEVNGRVVRWDSLEHEIRRAAKTR